MRGLSCPLLSTPLQNCDSSKDKQPPSNYFSRGWPLNHKDRPLLEQRQSLTGAFTENGPMLSKMTQRGYDGWAIADSSGQRQIIHDE